MITYNKEKIENANKWNDDSIYVLADFDRTITLGNSESSWGVLSKSKFASPEYSEERTKLYSYYHPYEINEKLDYEEKNKIMIEWWDKHIELFNKYKLEEKIIEDAATNPELMSFRDGAIDFLRSMRDRNIPVIIISAGIGNFIDRFLTYNNCNFENIHILSNFIKFENGIASGLNNEVIHSLNKNEVSNSDRVRDIIKDRNNIILLGDSISDVKMASDKDREDALKIGFLNENEEENMIFYKNAYDVVCTDNTTYKALFDEIKILKK